MNQNLNENVVVFNNTKHKNDLVIRYKIPVGDKQWWKFWKKVDKKPIIIEINDKDDSDIKYVENELFYS